MGTERIGGDRRRIVFLVLIVLLFVAAARLGGGYLPQVTAWVERQGAWGIVGFIAAYAIATVAAFPGSLLTLAAGAIFGVAKGATFVLAGAIIGSSLAFLLARYVARPIVERRIHRDPRFVRVDAAVAREGWKMVLLLRLSPLLPFNALNYALGLTAVTFRHYLIGAIGMLPGTLLYVYSGKVAGELAVVAGGGEVARGPAYIVVLGLGLLATIIVAVWIGRIARRALNEGLESDSTPCGV